MKTESYGVSDIGLSRLNNEDVWAQMPGEGFYILADGMGGHNAGEVAASETVVFLCSLIKKTEKEGKTSKDWIAFIEEGIRRANSHIHALASTDKEKEGMGTTLCLCLLLGKELLYAHVGDSRIYRIRKGRLTQLTKDHSLRGDLIEKGELDESLALSFPYKNVITRAIGTQASVKPEIAIEPLENKDLYLLCSDGLTDAISDAQIHDIIDESGSLKEATDTLILEAKKAGSSDNITVILFQINF